jgi:hypothetical protein
MKTLFSLAIYQRATDLVVVPMSGGVGELHFAVEPIECVSARLIELAQAIDRSILASDLSLGVVNLRGYKSPIARAVGMRSNKQFDASVRWVCGVCRNGADIELTLERHAHDGRGFEPTGRAVKLTPPQTANDIAHAVLKLLGEASA